MNDFSSLQKVKSPESRMSILLAISTHHDWPCGLFALGKGQSCVRGHGPIVTSPHCGEVRGGGGYRGGGGGGCRGRGGRIGGAGSP